MKKRIGYEFVATKGKDGAYYCRDLPLCVQEDKIVDIDSAKQKSVIEERMKTYSDVDKVFFDSYQNNFNPVNNALLKQAQENLIEMQKRMLDELKSI